MWEPSDLDALPTAQELVYAKEAIKQIEEVLKAARRSIPQTQLRVANSELELESRRAWAAPVRRIPFDILSIIFAICGEDAWKTSLSIAAVSHTWRDTVLATPGAWAFLDLEKCQEYAGIQLFFNRSGSMPLHIYLPVNWWVLLLDPGIAERLHCLSLESLDLDAGDVILPNLRWLLIRGDCDTGTPVDCINHTRLPALRHFATKSFLQEEDHAWPIANPRVYSRLESLSLLMVNDTTWLDLLRACRDSLRFLRLELIEDPVFPTQQVALPRLQCLEIYYQAPSLNAWPLDLETPALETYVESEIYRRLGNRPYSDRPLHSDVATVQFMRTELLPSSFGSFPMLRTLQINDYPHRVALSSYEDRIVPSLSRLCSNEAICPDITSIQLFADWGLERGRRAINRVENPRRIRLEAGREWSCDPVGLVTYSWGVKIPCNWVP